jgi:hypothetical protein
MVAWAFVRGCDGRYLVAAVNIYNGFITGLDATTDRKVSEAPPVNGEDRKLFSCVAASPVIGCTLVATGYDDGMVLVREAESGNLVRQWRAPSGVDRVVIDAAARRVMAVCGDGALRVWSFEVASMDQDDGKAGAQRKKVFDRWPVVGLSPDGQTAATSDWCNVILWNATTGNAIRQIKPHWPSDWSLRAITISNNAHWILAVGTIDSDSENARLLLWDWAGQILSLDEFKVSCYPSLHSCSLSFTPDGHGCTLLIENCEEGTREMHVWTISATSVVKVETAALTNALPLPCINTGGTRELLLQGETLQLAVSRVARSEGIQCTCTAVAYFDSTLFRHCASSSPSTLSGPSLSAHRNHSTVMAGLHDGTVHFMEFRV